MRQIGGQCKSTLKITPELDPVHRPGALSLESVVLRFGVHIPGGSDLPSVRPRHFFRASVPQSNMNLKGYALEAEP
jgi:hypothetical protein